MENNNFNKKPSLKNWLIKKLLTSETTKEEVLNYIASDQMALLSVTKEFIFLEEGDIAEIKIDKITITMDTKLATTVPAVPISTLVIDF